MSRPNLVFVFADQMRHEAMGHAGNPAVHTPHMDRLAREGFEFTQAIAGIPVCTPWRACLLTGQYPLKHGLFLNDIQLPTDRPTFGTVLKEAGYRTGYIGKWHLDGPHRKAFTPPGPRRQGFDFWAVANCTHRYLNSHYYRDHEEPLHWDGYDAIAQTDCALSFLKEQRNDPFALFLSWGPPHNPYREVPERYLAQIDRARLPIRPNCPEPNLDDLQGYYAHVNALDEQLGRLLKGLESNGQLGHTLFVFTSDHGDMLGSQRQQRKQRPWEESIHVPLLMHAPLIGGGRRVDTLVNGWDLMPTLLSLLEVPVPATVQGLDLSGAVTGKPFEDPAATLCCLPASFSEYRGEPWRAVRTRTHTYARNLSGPWLLYDNARDPYQLENLIGRPEAAGVQATLETELQAQLARFGDEFAPAEEYIRRWSYAVDKSGAIAIA